MKNPNPIETPSSRAKRTLSKRVKKPTVSNKLSAPKLSVPLTLSDPPDPPSPFKHINATEQIKGSTGGGGTGLFFKNIFTVVTPSSKEFNLTFAPLANSEIVTWNGLVLVPGGSFDYIVVAIPTNQVQLSGSIVLNVGDTIMVSYSYTV